MPDKHDVSDWLDAGQDVDELVKLAEHTPEWEPGDVKAEQAEPSNKPRALIMRRGNTIDDKGTRYLWRRRLVMNALNVVFSRPGRGKSTMAADLTAHVTTGKAFIDGSPCEIGEVLYFKGEGTDASIRDRMQQAGADPKKYHVGSSAEGEGEAMIDLAKDTQLVVNAIGLHPGTKLIIVDTLDSMFPSMRMIDNANIRRCLWPLQQLAEEHGICIVLLAHTNKGGYYDPIDRLSGGRAIGAAARSVWYLGMLDPESDECFLASVKCNDFLPAETLSYKIVGTGPDMPGQIRWGDARADVSAWDLDQPKRGSSNKAEDCKAWLSDLLANGPVETKAATLQAKVNDYGDHVIRKAKAALGITVKAAKGVQPTQWYWCLPDQKAPDSSDAESEGTV